MMQKVRVIGANSSSSEGLAIHVGYAGIAVTGMTTSRVNTLINFFNKNTN